MDIKKYKFKIQRMKFLGYIISINSIEIDPEKIAMIKT
jgi:hypothetical protein